MASSHKNASVSKPPKNTYTAPKRKGDGKTSKDAMAAMVRK